MNSNNIYLKKWFAIALVYFGLVNGGFSQNLNFKRVSIDDGLTAVSIKTIYQDSQDFVWIGTQDGLNRYDGNHVKVFKTDQYASSSLPSNEINCLFEDKNNILYIGTNDGGFSEFNKRTELFTNYKAGLGSKTLLDNSIAFIFELNPSELLLATEKGLSLFNKTTKKFKTINCLDSIEPINLRHIFRDSKNHIYIASFGNGLFEYDQATKTLNHHPMPKTILDKKKGGSMQDKLKIRCLTEVNGQLWCGSDEGIISYDPLDQSFSEKTIPDFDTKYTKRIVSFVADKNPDFMWIGTWGGLLKYNTKDGSSVLTKNNEFNQNSLSDNQISCMLKDKLGNLWIGTEDKGINIFFSSSTKFPLYNTYDGLTTDFVYSILETMDKNLWIGTGDGLYKKGYGEQKFVDVSSILKKHEASVVLSLLEDHNENIWIGTYGQGIIIYNPKTKGTKQILNDDVSFGTITKLIQDKNGTVWAGTFMGGLFAINPNSFTIKRYTTNQGLPSNKISTIYEDKKTNTLWIGTKNAGLCSVDFISSVDRPVIRVYKHIENKNSLSSNSVNSIYKDFNGIFWISTNDGLNKLDLTKKQFVVYTEKDGLVNSYIYASIPDNDGNLWLPSNVGLSKFNPNVENENGSAFKSYTIKDGIQAREFNQGAYFLSEDGKIYVGGISGVNYFYPKDIKENKITPNSYIYSFTRQGKEVKSDTSLLFKSNLEFSHKENFFTFEIIAVDFESSGKNKFIWKLEGYDRAWTSPSDARFITYTELPGGEYTLKIKANNSDSYWSDKSYDIRITVIPPWWKTTWFYIIAVILLMSLIFGFITYRTNSIKKENKILENKVIERTKELAEKNRDITSSIEYAKRIQEAILPSQHLIFLKLKNAFILYKPKDIVSGDFYWFGEKDHYKIIAVVDCTGHGVPGAFMSMIGHNLLNQIVSEKGNYDPGTILEELHKGVQAALKQGQNQINTNDGMDVSILAINMDTKECLWAGAFRSLVIINHLGELEKIDGNKYPVGGAQLDSERKFTTQLRTLHTGDCLYMFSDGYADQFGGDKGKKFMVKRFHNNLLSIRQMGMEEQRKELENQFEDWKGAYEQVDDVLVIGIKI